jgi:hypothetical protein
MEEVKCKMEKQKTGHLFHFTSSVLPPFMLTTSLKSFV